MLLTRNILIQGEDIETWGGQIVTSDTIEEGGKERYGQMIMHNVEVFNCSQKDTRNAAVRFEGAVGKTSVVTGSAIHNGHGWGMFIVNSNNVLVDNNVFFSFKPIGVGMWTVNKITFSNNIVSNIMARSGIMG